MINLTQRQLRSFVEVARLRSFTLAAAQLHITQSGLSSAVRDLEAQLSCRLFDRTTRSVALTPEGEQFLRVAVRVLLDLEQGAADVSRAAHQKRSRLVVGATPWIAAGALPEACRIYQQSHPLVTVDIRDLERDEVQQGVAEGELDIGFGAFLEAAPDITRKAIAPCVLVCVTPSMRPRIWSGAPYPRMRWEALLHQRLLSVPLENPVQRLVDEQLRRVGRAAPEDRAVFRTLQTVLAMVEAGLGAAVVPSFVAVSIKRYAVDISLMEAPVVPIPFFQITKRGRANRAAVAPIAEAVATILHASGAVIRAED